jgi:selenocysteine lyase/cysteine desulfurase
VEYSKSQPLKSQFQSKINVATLMKSKRDEVARFNIMQAQDEEVVFILNLEYALLLYQEGYHMDCQQSLNAHVA